MHQNDIREVSEEQLIQFFSTIGEKPFRIKQLNNWLWEKNVHGFDLMQNLPKKLIKNLKEQFTFLVSRIGQEVTSQDGTVKFIFRLHDNHLIEGVLIPSGKRVTACISSQVGCKLGCKFCATGSMGFTRNLRAWEIIDQYALMNQRSNELFDQNITNIVMMGMGEPLDNYEQVMKAINMLTSPQGNALSPSRITLSTVGLVDQIRQLADDQFKPSLAVSLHVANNEKRSQLMPANKKNPIHELQSALRYYHKQTNQRITIEYVLINGINDSLADAEELAQFCKAFPVKINLIQFNSTHPPYQKSPPENTQRFIQYLESKNMVVNLRRSRGEDIAAACGQLVKKKAEGGGRKFEGRR